MINGEREVAVETMPRDQHRGSLVITASPNVTMFAQFYHPVPRNFLPKYCRAKQTARIGSSRAPLHASA